MTTGQRVLVIIPTFNERENLPLIHRRVKDACPDVHVLVVDDSSPDGTGQVADELAAANPGHTHVLHRTAKNGLGAAYLEGFGWGLSRGYSVLVAGCWSSQPQAPSYQRPTSFLFSASPPARPSASSR